LAPIPFNEMDPYDEKLSRVGFFEIIARTICFRVQHGRIFPCKQVHPIELGIRTAYAQVAQFITSR
jgi:hypothetical protein